MKIFKEGKVNFFVSNIKVSLLIFLVFCNDLKWDHKNKIIIKIFLFKIFFHFLITNILFIQVIVVPNSMHIWYNFGLLPNWFELTMYFPQRKFQFSTIYTYLWLCHIYSSVFWSFWFGMKNYWAEWICTCIKFLYHTYNKYIVHDLAQNVSLFFQKGISRNQP